MSCNLSFVEVQCQIQFTSIEDEPLMNKKPALTITILSLIFLLVGVLLNGRIFKLLYRRKNGVIIDRLFMSNTIISGLGHSIVLLYYSSTYLVYPMSDFIGTFGCLMIIHFLDVFMRFYNFCFPVAIATVRYLFVVQNLWVRAKGMTKIVNAVITLSIIIPILMMLSVQLPISDQIHFAYNR
jgi:hypothetical protein